MHSFRPLPAALFFTAVLWVCSFPTSAKEFNSVSAEIAQFVRHEYGLAFAPPAHDGLVHCIEVRVVAGQKPAANVAGSPYRVDHRQAYLAPPPE